MSSVAEIEIMKAMEVQLPLGLLGFENIKTYSLTSPPDQEPFSWLTMSTGEGLAFLVLPPAFVLNDYAPDLSHDDVNFLEIRHPDDAMILNIVKLRPNGTATVNLKAPIVINRHTMIGKQVVLSQSAYAINHPIQSA